MSISRWSIYVRVSSNETVRFEEREKRFYCSCHSLLRHRGHEDNSRGRSATCVVKLIRYKAQARASWKENPEQNKRKKNTHMKIIRWRDKERRKLHFAHQCKFQDQANDTRVWSVIRSSVISGQRLTGCFVRSIACPLLYNRMHTHVLQDIGVHYRMNFHTCIDTSLPGRSSSCKENTSSSIYDWSPLAATYWHGRSLLHWTESCCSRSTHCYWSCSAKNCSISSQARRERQRSIMGLLSIFINYLKTFFDDSIMWGLFVVT